MAHVPLTAAIPPDLDLDAGYTITFAAVDPTSGAAVASVTVSAAAIFAANLSGSLAGLDFGPFMLVQGPQA